MFINQMDLLASRERHNELLREADAMRLVQVAEEGQGDKGRRVQRVVVWMGGQLVQWGWTLQRYGAVQPVHVLQAAGEQVDRGRYE